MIIYILSLLYDLNRIEKDYDMNVSIFVFDSRLTIKTLVVLKMEKQNWEKLRNVLFMKKTGGDVLKEVITCPMRILLYLR